VGVVNKITAALIKEIEIAVKPKLFNVNHGTASEMEMQIVQECLGYLSLIKFSCLKPAEIKRIWDKTNLKFM
jgi:hypothetical protein